MFITVKKNKQETIGVLVEKYMDYKDDISLFHHKFHKGQVRWLPHGYIPEWHVITTGHISCFILWFFISQVNRNGPGYTRRGDDEY